jgi:enamine deaminase RidA (YjgF/YER057c/UK114 family)
MRRAILRPVLTVLARPSPAGGRQAARSSSRFGSRSPHPSLRKVRIMVSFLDPPSVHKPGAAYSHTAVVPAGTELVFLSGQVGLRVDGSASASVAEQAEQVFANISALLAAHGLDASALVKLTTFLAAGQDIQAVRAARSKFLGGHRPTSTLVYVSQLADPAWHVEVEAIAARSAA